MLKRSFDIIIAVISLILLAPVLIMIGLLVALKLGRPVFFTQVRPGLNEEPFNIIKFRTMTSERDDKGNLLPNNERMTPFGSFLRTTSLDELPELINVLKGEMSLVGPRPLLLDYLPYFTKIQNKRHNVKPGITGWSQINGRNSINWDKKLELDIWYVDHQNFLLDLKILLLTILKVVKREGINYSEDTLMPRFDEYVKNKNQVTN